MGRSMRPLPGKFYVPLTEIAFLFNFFLPYQEKKWPDLTIGKNISSTSSSLNTARRLLLINPKANHLPPGYLA
jgi:hypothetical protein